jgi:hypothetical protein
MKRRNRDSVALGVDSEVVRRKHVDLDIALHERMAGAHNRNALEAKVCGRQELGDPPHGVRPGARITQRVAVET